NKNEAVFLKVCLLNNLIHQRIDKNHLAIFRIVLQEHFPQFPPSISSGQASFITLRKGCRGEILL
ncbi:hypothetical protein MUP95_09950, partial [bacterium]|nr:hypothetical protein [bacterium]